MRTLRTVGIVSAAVVSGIALAILPGDDAPADVQPGVVVGTGTEVSDDVAPLPDDAATDTANPAGQTAPRGSAPSPAPAPPSSDDGSGAQGGGTGAAADVPEVTTPAQSAPGGNSGVCEWDDDGWECDDADDGGSAVDDDGDDDADDDGDDD